MAAKYRMDLEIGTTLRRKFKPYNDTDGVRTPWNLSVYSFVLRIRDGDHKPIGEYDLPVVDDYVVMSIDSDITETFSAHRRYFYALDATDAAGVTTRLIEGPLVASAEG